MDNKRIGGLVIGSLFTFVSGLAFLLVLFQIVRDLSGTFFGYTYRPPWTEHEIIMRCSRVACGKENPPLFYAERPLALPARLV